MIELRRGDRADAESLGRLRAFSMIEMGYLRADERDRFAVRAGGDIRELFDANRLIAWVACDAEHVAGSACATFFERLPYPDGALHAEVGGVYVEPAYRGHGHASRLVEAVLADVRGVGVRGTFLRPSPRSKPLYSRLGFVEEVGGLMRLPKAASALGGLDEPPSTTDRCVALKALA